MQLIPHGQELDQIVSICKVLATTPFYQKLGPGGVLAIWLSAREAGLPVMEALNGGMYTFSGKVTLSTHFMNMLIIKAGHRVEILALNEQECQLVFHRKDRTDTFSYGYTLEQARKAGYLSKDNWIKHPKDMLFCRALSGGVRKFMPDVISSYYVAGELDNTPEYYSTEHLSDKVVDIKSVGNDGVSSIPLLENKIADKEEIISDEQLAELNNLLSRCNHDFQKNFLNTLQNVLKIDGLCYLPLKHYELALKRFSDHIMSQVP